MKDWTDGYVADIGYTYGYYGELNPLRTQWTFLNAGLVPPAAPGPGVTACELGFGQGVSVAFHAASSATEWWGTDFNPSQAAHAAELVRAAGVNAQLADEAFADFCRRDDLPMFDSIGMHGIWSWVSDENRAVIVDFVRRKLKVGGVLYVSYNTQPGWSGAMPLRQLLTAHAAVMGTAGEGILARIDRSIEFAERLFAAEPGYLRANPSVADRLARMKALDRSYLAHEFFNRDWAPMYFNDMQEWLEPAKLSYACSAHILDHIDALNLSTEQQRLVAAAPAGGFRETVRDYCVNQQFRRDYWVKGPQTISAVDQAERLQQMTVVLATPAKSVNLKVTGPIGELQLNHAIYPELLKLLGDHRPRTVGEIAGAVEGKGFSPSQLREALSVLMGTAALQLCQDEHAALSAKPHTDRLNLHLMKRARAGGLNYLVSPRVGGYGVSRTQQLFLLARREKLTAPADLARFAWQHYEQLGQRLVKDGKTLETAGENLAELTAQADEFLQVQLPVLTALLIS